MSNRVVSVSDSIEGLEINWLGDNSIIEIGEGFSATNLKIDVYSNVHVHIGSNVEINRCYWSFYDNCECDIGDNVSWGNRFDSVPWGDGSEMYLFHHSKASIGAKSHLTKNDLIVVYTDSALSIGTGALIARNVTIRTGDGHPIFDRDSGEQINILSGRVDIQDHVWLCEHSKILANTAIGEGSVVAANSLIKGEIPPHCIYGGIAGAGKIIRENIEWRR